MCDDRGDRRAYQQVPGRARRDGAFYFFAGHRSSTVPGTTGSCVLLVYSTCSRYVGVAPEEYLGVLRR